MKTIAKWFREGSIHKYNRSQPGVFFVLVGRLYCWRCCRLSGTSVSDPSSWAGSDDKETWIVCFRRKSSIEGAKLRSDLKREKSAVGENCWSSVFVDFWKASQMSTSTTTGCVALSGANVAGFIGSIEPRADTVLVNNCFDNFDWNARFRRGADAVRRTTQRAT